MVSTTTAPEPGGQNRVGSHKEKLGAPQSISATAFLHSTPPLPAVALAYDWLSKNPKQALANFTWVNNVTLGAAHCRFACDEAKEDVHCLARHVALPFTAISVEATDPAILRRLAARLLPTNQAAYTLAPQRISAILSEAACIIEIHPEWQMVFRSAACSLDPGAARLLGPGDLPAMQGLAQTGEAMVFSPDSLQRGAFYGVFAAGELAAMGGVQNELPGWAEIGSIVTHPAYRRQGYAAQVVSALIHHLQDRGQGVFLCLFQTNTPARALYEKLGFEIANELHLLHWRLT